MRHHVTAIFAVGIMALGLSGCASAVPEEIAPSQVRESPTTGAETDSSVELEDVDGVVELTVAGDQGVLALQHSGTIPSGTAGPTDRKLITGPGGCFALVNEGKPQLLVFPAEATFVLQEGKPSATIAGVEHLIGQQFAVDMTAVAKTSVAGIPDRCDRGSDDTVFMVN